jgi:hypothetical protein
MARTLPIKFFSKREVDDRLTEARGSTKLPSWILEEEEIKENAYKLDAFLSYVNDLVDEKKSQGDFLPTVISSSISDDAIAKSHRGKINKLFNVNNKRNTIGFDESNSLIVKIDNQDDLRAIRRNLSQPDRFIYSLSAIESIALFKPFIDFTFDAPIKIQLINYWDYDVNKIASDRFIRLCEENKIEYSITAYTDTLNIYCLEKYNEESLDKVLNFSGLQSAVKMPFYAASLSDDTGEEYIVPVKKPLTEVYYPIVGVLDSGISKIEHLEPWIDGAESFYVEEDLETSHGTFVAGLILYGDQLERKDYTGANGCKLFDATVFPKWKSISETELIQNIKEIIEKYPGINIWQLSIGGEAECKPSRISEFGAFLDFLQEQYNILIIKSAGNCDNYKKHAPRSRIKSGSDSVRSLIVGSIAHNKREYDLSEINHPSPFTVRGPSIETITKPDLVHYGGNAGIVEEGRFSTTGVNSFRKDGGYASNIGTSFSAPRVTSLVAEVEKNIEGTFNPLLTKALLIHSAKYPDNINIGQNEKLNLLGFGLPANIGDMIYNNPNEITLILQDTIHKGSFIEILDFPFPEELVEGGLYFGEITITLVASPILDPDQGPEYCQSNIEVLFGTFDDIVDREGPTIKNPIGRDQSINFLNDSIYSVVKQRQNKSFLTERMLINYGNKYQPIKKWVVDLAEIKDTPRVNYLTAPKRWYLKLNGYFRESSESKLTDLSQDFCLIITIRDNTNQHNIYQSVSGMLNQRNFINNDIRLRQRVTIRT